MILSCRGKEKVKFIIDDNMSHLFKDNKFWIKKKKYHSYVYCIVNKKNKYLHRLIVNAKDGEFVDHINGDALDNRLSNLRVCTISQNNCNQKKKNKWTSSIYKGVAFFKKAKKYRARIAFKNEQTYLGLFRCPVEAAYAYDVAALRLHGSFAKTNFLQKAGS